MTTFQLNRIDPFEVTRNLYFESMHSHREYCVFDDADILGHDQFHFLQAGYQYNCKLGIFGDIDEAGEAYTVSGYEQIGHMHLVRVTNSVGDVFYFNEFDDASVGSKVHLLARRFDLLAVGDIINDRSLEGILAAD